MPKPSFTPIALQTSTDVASLRNSAQVALNRLVNQLNQHDHVFVTDIDAKNYTIKNLSIPSNQRDATPKQYVDDAITKLNADLQNQLNRRTRPYLNGPGGGGTSTSTSTTTFQGTYVQSTNTSGTFTPDIGGQKDSQEITLTVATTTIKNPSNSATDIKWDLIAKQDGTGGRKLVFDTLYAGLTNASSNIDLDTTAGTYTIYRFVVRPDGKSMMLSPALTGRTY